MCQNEIPEKANILRDRLVLTVKETEQTEKFGKLDFLFKDTFSDSEWEGKGKHARAERNKRKK